MKPQSAKAKGAALQRWVRDLIYANFPQLSEGDVESRSMGASGEDLMLSPAARACVPYSIECKAVEALNVYKAFEQAQGQNRKHEALLVMKKNRKRPLAVVDAEHYFNLLRLYAEQVRGMFNAKA